LYYLEGIALVWRTAPALVHANDYNTMWIGIAAKLLCGSRVIYDCHELWPDRNGRPEWRPWLLACEALFVRVADATVTTSPGYAEAIAKRYRVRPPVLVRNIPRGWAPAPSRSAPRAGDAGPRTIYVGGLMPGRGLEQAIQALAYVPDGRLRLLGPGAEGYIVTLLRCAEQEGVSAQVQFEAPVHPAGVQAAIAGADVGLMLIQPVCRSYELTLPNKLFEYAAAGVPILASDLPVIGPIIREQGLGEAVPPTDIEQIAAAIRRLAQPAINHEVRQRVRSFGQRETWQHEQLALERVYRAVLAADGAS
jgi:glycosyltransferase involved in cell wall biosynthesis